MHACDNQIVGQPINLLSEPNVQSIVQESQYDHVYQAHNTGVSGYTDTSFHTENIHSE